MGFLRTFLAIAVVLGHSTPIQGYFGIPPDVAVTVFFMVSGFYMSLILSEKYVGTAGLRAFYTGRALRIFPIYYVALLSMVAAQIVASHFGGKTILSNWEFVRSCGVSTAEGALWMLPNLVLFGSELPFLFHHGPTTGTFFSFGLPDPALPDAVRISPSLLIGPAWTLGAELWFYLLVPFLARFRNLPLLGLAIGSLVLKIYLEHGAPWSSYFFFPANLCFFVFGMLSQRVCRSAAFMQTFNRIPGLAPTVFVVVLLVLVVFRQYIPLYRNYGWMVYVLIATCLPLLFTVTKRLSFDRWIGTLSYPIYILHAPVLLLFHEVMGWKSGAAALLGTLTISVAAVLLIDEPLERWRQRRIRSLLSASPTPNSGN